VSTAVPEGQSREFDFAPGDFDRARKLIYDHSGISLSPQKADLVYNRLTKRLRASGLHHFGDYLALVEKDAQEFELFVNALTTNLTAFFREKHHFDALADYVRRHRKQSGLRVWCAASSTGEEPYSLAMTLAEVYDSFTPPVELIATDLDTAVLATAAQGVYPLERFDHVPEALRKRYFLRGTGRHEGFARARPELRATIAFCQLNLCAADWNVPQKLDVIFARNVLIYFDRETQQAVIAKLCRNLNLGGYLFVSHSESLSGLDLPLTSVGSSCFRKTDRDRKDE
jgi:chemotaxis protein methyltransferase CheR